MRCWRKRCARLLRNSLHAHWRRINRSCICVCMTCTAEQSRDRSHADKVSPKLVLVS